MLLSDVSIKRPVFATVMSLILIVLGVVSFTRLPLRELPDVDPPVVSVNTSYTGASAAVVESRITQVLEDAISGIEGVDLITATSRNGRSDINIEFTLTRDIEGAANDVRDAISRVSNRLPEDVDPPRVAKQDSDSRPIMYLNLSEPRLSAEELTDYAERNLVDQLSSIDGVSSVFIGGGKRYAMRVWLDADALSARGLTADDVGTALRRENIELPGGSIESRTREFALRVMRGYQTPESFQTLVVGKGSDGHVITLGEVARVELASEERRAYYHGNGVPQIGLGVVATSTANSLEVARNVRALVERVSPSLPKGMQMTVPYDTTVFTEAAVHEVYKTLAEAIALVLLVVFVFLGSVRAALIPAVTVPVCVTAAFMALYACGFSINQLTLLSLVLSIGLVVDDAIVVLENCQRRTDLGEPSLLAAQRGTRQVAFAVIATTVVLIAVFLPIAFMEGNTGRLFRELAVAVAGAVAISGFVALTLTPTMCSILLRPHTHRKGFNNWVNDRLDALTRWYRGLVGKVVGRGWLLAAVMLATFAASGVLFKLVPSELAPAEDRGDFNVSITGPEGAGFDYMVGQMAEIEKRLLTYAGDDKPVSRVITRVPGGFGGQGSAFNSGRATVFLKRWEERDVSTQDVMEDVRKRLADIPGVRITTEARQGLVRGSGRPVQFVIRGPTYETLAQWRNRMLLRMEENPRLLNVDSDYKETLPQIRVDIDRARAADLGVPVQAIGSTLQTMLGSLRAGTYEKDGEEYYVVMQAPLENRRSLTDISGLYVRSATTGQLIPLSNLVKLTENAEAGTLSRFNRMRAITLSAGLAPGYTVGEALEYLRGIAAEELPPEAQVDYKGESREFMRSSGAVFFTFGMALLVVFLVLAAQFESFLHPLVIMLTVPLAMLGALLGLAIWGVSLNLYSQIGIVMLVGLAAKNGILIVEFANQLRDEGRSVAEAIVEAATVRLRPILMTSVAMICGALPLMLSSGAGAASRASIGVVIVFGVAFSTLLSLFVVPAFYSLLAPYTKSPEAVAHKLAELDAEVPPVGGHE
ncbi:efflux RND transporter permease subunit [Pseudoxanthomonas sangjuensis]|uniref:efflux RND transporter permease subunit n=1 Tax=Pseudoxanthomonas sangjuensis TaxID=1503750 RepID=UPI0013912CBB|nr:efflux RND transporter permease subunit [Pseudoxanthomonas sangjuensis]KAF1710998.1 multidrug transporter AcrB [Pseudoxanthomonas sangjuensis]